jgi:hypothetical protein
LLDGLEAHFVIPTTTRLGPSPQTDAFNSAKNFVKALGFMGESIRPFNKEGPGSLWKTSATQTAKIWSGGEASPHAS